MQIDPKTAIWLNILYVILSAVAAGSVHIAGLSPDVMTTVVSVCGLGAVVLNGVLHGFSSPAPGPLASPPLIPPIAKTVILLAVLLPAFWGPQPVSAQANRKTGMAVAVPCDPLHLIPGCQPTAAQATNATQGILTALAKPFADFQAAFGDDTAGAAALAVAIPGLQDGNGQACWMAMEKTAAVFKAHPMPVAQSEPGSLLPVTVPLATDLEAVRLLAMSFNQLCANPACTQVFSDVTNMVSAAGGPIAQQLPSLSSICSRIAQIPVAPPVTPAADVSGESTASPTVTPASKP
jgi:hypothetical protein